MIDRVRLINDLEDYKADLEMIVVPRQSKQIDILSRAVEYVRGQAAQWLTRESSRVVVLADSPIAIDLECSHCHFKYGCSDFRYCPNCNSRMTNVVPSRRF